MTKYEKYVIHPILSMVEKYQDFLCKPENLPQLAKLGFMFEKLWYAGRVCYGYNGIIKKGGYTCENNPKYELEDGIKYNSENNENLIYDAWGIHISNDGNQMNFEEFSNLILNGKPLSEFEVKYRKSNKTFDEWVEVLTDKQFKYSSMYPNRRSVANHLLCTIGNGYGYNKKTGIVFNEAGGADQDQDGYGDWENSKFIPEIQIVVNAILTFNMTKIAMDAESTYVKKLITERKEKEFEKQQKFHESLLPLINETLAKKGEEPVTMDSEKYHEIFAKYMKLQLDETLGKRQKIEKSDYEYYPICNYSIIMMFDKNTHLSYIKAGLEICEDIVAFPPKIKENYNEFQIKQRNEMIEFAKNYIEKWKE
jgi:hypothetical protein